MKLTAHLHPCLYVLQAMNYKLMSTFIKDILYIYLWTKYSLILDRCRRGASGSFQKLIEKWKNVKHCRQIFNILKSGRAFGDWLQRAPTFGKGAKTTPGWQKTLNTQTMKQFRLVTPKGLLKPARLACIF